MRQTQLGFVSRWALVGAAALLVAAALPGCGESGPRAGDQDSLPAAGAQSAAASAGTATPAAEKPQRAAPEAARAAPVTPRPAREEPLPPGERISLTAGLRKAMEAAETTPVPEWVPLYPESERPARVSPVGGKLTFEQQAQDARDDVLLHYKRTLKKAGFEVEIESDAKNPSAPGVVVARKAEPPQSLRITVTPIAGGDGETRLLFVAESGAAE